MKILPLVASRLLHRLAVLLTLAGADVGEFAETLYAATAFQDSLS